MLQRQIFDDILLQLKKSSSKRKALIILGPRQTGKTTLLQMIIQAKVFEDKETVFLNGDDYGVKQALEKVSSDSVKPLVAGKKLIIIDEAQRIKNIGLTAKIIIDQFPEQQLILTGSSALELSNTINEPLTGRKREYLLLPFSCAEMVNHSSYLNEKQALSNRLIYGSFPEVINNPGDEKEILNSLAGSYLYKDIFTYQEIRKPELLQLILQNVALQVGSELSIQEIANSVKVDAKTVSRYIMLLEKTYIIFRLPALNRNIRNELKKKPKLYFYDNGIRNAIIGQLSPSVELRLDKGALWENYLVSERLKYIQYNRLWRQQYFWRNKNQQEIDYIEQTDNIFDVFEFKFSENKVRWPASFNDAYAPRRQEVINRENYIDWLTENTDG